MKTFGELKTGDAFKMFKNDSRVYFKDHCGGAYRKNNLGDKVFVGYVPPAYKVEPVKAA